MQINPVNSLFDTSAASGAIRSNEGASLAIPQAGMDTLNGSDAAEGAGKSFGQMLQNAIGEVNQAQIHAGDMTARFAAGEKMDVHQVMIASQEAGISLALASQVRNKVVDAFQELMRTSV